jgi:hypothetical protein
MRAVRRVNEERATAMQPKRMAVQPKVHALQTALAGSQTPVRALQKGLLLNGWTAQLGQQARTVEQYGRIAFQYDQPKEKPRTSLRSWCVQDAKGN